jgi:hypothetical protein
MGEHAAKACKHKKRITSLYERWETEPGGFGRWLDAADAYTPGERLFFAVHPNQEGDREAAANWWQKLCGDDAVHANESEFVGALVVAVATQNI